MHGHQHVILLALLVNFFCFNPVWDLEFDGPLQILLPQTAKNFYL